MLALLVPTLLGLWMALRYSRRAHQADRALQDANAQLEARVLARTQELSRSELRLRTLFESAADAVLIIEEERITACNPAAVALFGADSAEDLLGRDPSAFSPAEQPGGMASAALAQQYRETLLRTPDQPLSFEWTHQRAPCDETFTAMVRLSVMHIEGRALVQANVRDISERLQAQEDLRIASKVFESWEGMTVTDAQHRILRVNSAFTRITGYAANEVMGQTPKLLQSGRHGPEFYRAMHHTLATGGFWQGEVWNRRKSGEIYPQLLTVSAVRNTAGHTTHYVGIFLDQSSQKAAEQQIEHLAFYDPLTGLANRRLLLDRMAQARAASLRHMRHSALLLVDLDEFKLLNDSIGHEAGDAILQQLAQRVRHCLRDGDTAARCGGDEFALMLEDLSEDPLEAAAQAEVVAEKMRSELALPCTLPEREHRTTCSIGVALFGGGPAAPSDSPLKQAEVAMFQAKQAGRNTIRFFEPQMQEAVSRRAALEVELRHAIDTGQLLLHYQPQVSGDGRTCGVEALVRWQHPTRGMVSPADFIPLAEETGLILPLGQWVLEQACRQLAAWQAQPSTRALSVAVNVSARQFHHPQFVEVVHSTLRASGADARLLKLELTESMLVQDLDKLVTKMNALRALGVCFALDDFGTGYSSLAYLKRLPLDQLKIDQGFVRNLLTDANDVAIAKMVVALAQSLNLSVIAEGVEHPAQRDCLAHLGCYQYQGYLFGRPMPADLLESSLQPTPET
jgi:diguanylate cyclase (GGDEF)-like protein/PAS domain S-box-containing protein